MIMLIIAWICSAVVAIVIKDVSALGDVSIVTFFTGMYYAIKGIN
jgi:hypothetical protein